MDEDVIREERRVLLVARGKFRVTGSSRPVGEGE